MCYTTNPIRITERLTKRNVLAAVAQIFDPLGLLGPVVLYAKKIMQDVWRAGIHWDESVSECIYTEWLEFTRQLDLIEQITFPRKLLVDDCREVQIHGFCDASNIGYGACLYVRSKEGCGSTISNILCAKSQVAPLKTITLPRLELCGASLLAQLYREIRSTLNIVPSKTVFWSDSTIVLHWLKTPPHSLKTFVANRVTQIQELTSAGEWRHVRSGDNPADAVSRGQLPHAFIRNSIWFAGPSWLVGDESEWPNEMTRAIEVPELKRNICLQAIATDVGLLERFSSYSKLIRVTAYCCRFRPTNNYTGSLCAKEIEESETRILKMLQVATLLNEIEALKGDGLKKRNQLSGLSPFLDQSGVMRVGGRIQKAELMFSRKHPILLPNRHHLTDCIIREIHENNYHTGIQNTLHFLRQRFWLLDGRNQVRKIVRACSRCSRFNAKAIEYKMGNLPPVRVRQAVPFSNTGIDFCGPFFIKEKKYRNRARIKAYVCVFVCMAVKAVHLEVVSDLSSEGFIAALRRFVARRGLPDHIFSDNGTNFVGANNQLKELFVMLNSDEHKTSINKFASERRITWHFIPPVAPHFGGLWESIVKLFKHHFKRVVGDSLFTFEELNTFTAEVEGILNSRPITSLSSDPNDMVVLTPAHYLIGRPLISLPENDLSVVPVNRLYTWKHITKVRQDFWTRWHTEYLNEFQKRTKWVKDGSKIEIGTVVLIKDKNLPCMQWALGRIIQLHPGEDGIAQVATIKTASGEIKRSTTSLCPLLMEQY
ncbi:PREDICTED: uncharacterized protein LOC108771166 [Trachymyrmex cornetzi]|uniref:uncharacterized protein LOC108771166 n=1 Tax=Trachymyrmex cornetzi TaxID=471704 RepID=UPI00084F3008|nr:PREDICTED: uncharacterized protein LOC108771166 [Trachymyrmex cornetzi]